MVKSISTIYISSEILTEAKAKNLPISQICEEALKLSLNVDTNTGSVGGALGTFLNLQAEKKKDMETIRRLSRNRDQRFNRALKAFGEKYSMELIEVLKFCGL